MTAPPPKPPDERPGDSRTESFLRQAGPIIASERGLNAKSRVKLESLARDMRLPDEVFDQCMQMLQGNPPAVKRKPTRWERAFEKFLHGQLRKIRADILTADMERKAIEYAKKKYALTESQAQDVIQSVTEKVGIGRISISDAERHVEGVISEKIGDSAWIDDATRQRFHSLGREWGVPISHVEALVETYTQQNLQQQQRDQRAGNLFIAAGVMIALVVLGGFVVFTINHRRSDSEDQGDSIVSPDVTGDDEDEEVTAASIVPPAWWDQRLNLAVVKTRIKIDRFDEVYAMVAAEDAETRAAGYQQLVRLALSLHDDREASAQLRSVLSELVAQEPNEECVDALIEPLVAKLLPTADRLPDEPIDYDRSLWAVETLVEMMPEESKDVPDEVLKRRRDRIQSDLVSATNASVINAYGRRELTQRHLRSLAESLYQHLIANAKQEPKRSLGLRDRLSKLTDRYFTDEQLVQLDTQFATSILLKQPDQWPDLRKLISQCIASGTPTEWIQMLGVVESTDNEGLQLFIASQLGDVLGTSLPSNDLDEISSLLRRKLGATAQSLPVTGSHRWSVLRRKNKTVDQELKIARDDPQMVAPSISGLTHAATLACALAQGEGGYSYFDRMIEEETLKRDERSSGGSKFLGSMFGGSSSKRPSRQVLEAFDRKIQRLDGWSTLNPRSRSDLLKRIASDDVPRIEDIRRGQAIVIAGYIVAAKKGDEFKENLLALRSLSQWNQVVIAVADALLYGDVPKEAAQQIASAVVGIDLLLDGGEQQWKQNLGNRLLSLASERLLRGASNTGARDYLGFGELQSTYLAEYDRRADILSGATIEKASSDSVNEAMENCLAVAAETLSSKSRRPASTALLESLDQQVDVAYYVGANNLAQTVALQRIFVRIVAAITTEDLPQFVSKIDDQLKSLDDFDQQATDVVEQLREGEVVLLELWSMYDR